MTVCVAGICVLDDDTGATGIMVAADQMLTDGATSEENEPNQAKFFPLGDRTVILVSGDLGEGLVICRAVLRDLGDIAFPSVQGVAKRLSLAVTDQLRARFQQKYLDRHKTTIQALGDGTAPLLPATASRLRTKFERFDIGCDFIVAGIDDLHSPELWCVYRDGQTLCADPWGYAATGIGEELARQHLKRINYHRSWGRAQALFAVYSAKRRAELMQGVGDKHTTILAITPDGLRQGYSDPILNELKKHYEKHETAVERAFHDAATECGDVAYDLVYENKLWLTQQAREQARAQEPPPASTHDP